MVKKSSVISVSSEVNQVILDDKLESALLGVKQDTDTLESRKYVKGINITNWRDQLCGNATLNFNVTVKAILDGVKTGVELPQGFMLSPSKGASSSLLESYATGKVDDKSDEFCRIIGFMFTQMIIGKHLSIVNSGRGYILNHLIESVNPSELYVVIHGITVDETTKIDVEYNLSDINNLIKFYSGRARIVLNLETSSGRITKVLTGRKETKKVEW